MKKFIQNIVLFFSITFLIFVIGIILPVTPRASKSLLFAKIDKDSLLANVPSPRIIFIGGSNLSFGLNSQMILDSLGLNPINTAIHASIGLIYMLDNTLPYIQSGDIVVVAPEYVHFFGTNAYGGEELLRIIMDISPFDIMKLRYEQWTSIYSFFPQYSFSKFKPIEYFGFSESDIYGVSSFNKFGDAFAHWKLKKEQFVPLGSVGQNYNPTIIENLLNFERELQEKGAILLVTYPGYQATSFENSRSQIMMIESELKKNDFKLLGNPERYKIPDSLMFNTPYHLSKEGVDYRTNLLITDIENTLNRSTWR